MASERAKKEASKAKRVAAQRYRGIALVKPAVPPRTPIATLREAVDAAFSKHADAIARAK